MTRANLVVCISALGLAFLVVGLWQKTPLAGGQGSAGSIFGRVADSTQADLYDVTVTVTSAQTSTTRRVKTDDYGKYLLDSLPAGVYSVRAEGDGFEPAAASGVEVTAGAKVQVDLVMPTGPQRVPSLLTEPQPITMAELARRKSEGVSVTEVSDYVYGNYQGSFSPSPPHADLYPKKAYVIYWKNFPYRFVFSHEASYCPWFELPSGAGMSYQFFEGNTGWAELMNQYGRQEKNSFVQVIESGPRRAWVRWIYCTVNMQTGQPTLRGTEDFWAYPNGLILHRQVYQTLLPGDRRGYSREPIELIGMCPVGKLWFDVLKKDSATGESHALAVLDVFSEKRYDVYWKPKPGTVWDSTHRKSGCEWKDLEDSAGVLMADPMVDGAPFCVFGDASGFRHEYTNLKEHTFIAERWGSTSWDHWPIGWSNSQGHEVDVESLKLYPNAFSTLGMDFFALADTQEEKGIFYSLIGVAGNDLGQARKAARKWLDKGEAGIANPDSGGDLPALSP